MPTHKNKKQFDEISERELEEVGGGLGFRGLFGQFGGGVYGGPASASANVGVAPGFNPEGGALYGGTDAGVGKSWGFGVTGGATVGAVFGRDGQSFDNVQTGGSHNISFGIGQVGWNDNGFYVGVGPSGVGYSYSNTERLTEDPAARERVDNPAPMEPAPQLNDWSTAFGPSEGGPPLAGE